MKTVLPEAIKTKAEAEQFLTDLVNNKEAFHPEDDAHDIVWQSGETPTFEECEQLNKLMEDIYKMPGNDGSQLAPFFCPCEFILSLDK